MKRSLAIFMVILLAALVSAGCETDTDFVSPLPTEITTARYSMYLPIVSAGPPPWRSAKGGKCLKRSDAPCTAATSAGSDWEYWDVAYGEFCDDISDNVLYFAGPSHVKNHINLETSMESDYYMIYNEPDWGHWGFPPIEDLVEVAHDAVVQWPKSKPVGPCVADSVQYIRDFLQVYLNKYGESYPLGAVCGHCYRDASHCIDFTSELIELGDSLGVPTWITEYNFPPGPYLSASDVVRQNGCFTRFLEDHPSVGRYCMWGGGIEGDAGYGIPHDPTIGWQTTHYQYKEKDGSITWKTSYIGKGFAAEPPSWQECLDWGLVRQDQIVP